MPCCIGVETKPWVVIEESIWSWVVLSSFFWSQHCIIELYTALRFRSQKGRRIQAEDNAKEYPAGRSGITLIFHIDLLLNDGCTVPVWKASKSVIESTRSKQIAFISQSIVYVKTNFVFKIAKIAINQKKSVKCRQVSFNSIIHCAITAADSCMGSASFAYEAYQGEWLGHLPHGKGVVNTSCLLTIHDESNQYIAGKFIWEDGSVYDGEWIRGKLHGHGTKVNLHVQNIYRYFE